MRIAVYPYKLYSESARELVKAIKQDTGLWTKRISGKGKFRPRKRDLVINWGSSNVPNFNTDGIINDPNAVAIAINKLDAFRMFDIHGIRTPEWTDDPEKALSWYNDGVRLIARTVLTGRGGKGIIICNKNMDGCSLVKAPLYVKYKKKRKEFRVHVFKEKVIDVAEKRRDSANFDGSTVSYMLRNYHNGWVFCRQDLVEPSDLRDVAISAVKALGLDFGAVDIIWNRHDNLCYALEVNTAPGIEGTSLIKYKEAILNYV
jgi:glutathione synthase/RimK-type ligase-like ATP-grasp enzyme